MSAAISSAQTPAPASTQTGVRDRDIGIVRLGTPEQLKMPVQIPRGYAVIIGISNYKNLPKEGNLAYPEKDAENVYSTLISKEGGNIEFENVKKLVGPQATLANIKDALEVWLPSHAQESDRAIVFFVGHGVTDKNGRGYLAPYDIDPQKIAETGYPMDQLGDVMSKKVKARWKMLLTDACHSGKIAVSSTAAQINESLRGLPQGFLTLTSSRASEQSFEDAQLAGGNGVFSYFLVKGWQGEADVDPSVGVVTADELVTYVKREVRAYARARGAQQTPLEFGDFPDDLILGYSPQRRQQIVATLPQLSNGSVVVEVNLDNVQVSIDDQDYGIAAPGRPLRIPGLASGAHHVRGVRMGYEPVTVDVNVAPGAVQTVSLRLLRQRTLKPAAKANFDSGDAIWKRSGASASDLAKAADFFSKALKDEPAYSQAALGLCRIQQAQGKPADALKSCQRAVQIDEDYSEARTMSGALLMETGDYPEAVRQIQRAALQDPSNSFVQSLLAEALFLADRPKESEEAANRALDLDPSSAQAYLLRAEARRAQKRFDEAIVDYNRALQSQEFGSGALRVVAFWAIGTGVTKHRSGVQFLYRSQKASAYFGLCAAEIGRENYLHAIKFCNQSLSVEKDDPDSHLLLSQCYAGLFTRDNRRDYLLGAKDNLEAVLRLNPNIDQGPQLRAKLKEITELLGVVRN